MYVPGVLFPRSQTPLAAVATSIAHKGLPPLQQRLQNRTGDVNEPRKQHGPSRQSPFIFFCFFNVNFVPK